MSRTVLSVRDVGKCYPVYSSNVARFARWFGVRVAPVSEFWAVRNVSFEVAPGQAVALIGQNGAGKSTVLKLIAGTVRPNEGTVTVAGQVSAMLELGLGFNPEFTGRENVRLAGGMLGMSLRQIEDHLPEIEDFAEIGEFFDQPLRVYSSGMQARLAFALATAIRPDLLIVDEVLSVGDSYFQHKSFDRIRRFKEEGASVLFVSHGMAEVRSICDRVVLLDKGRVLRIGEPDAVIDHYNALIAAKESEKLSLEQRRRRDGWLHTRSGTGDAQLASLTLLDAATLAPVKVARTGQRLHLRADIVCQSALPSLVVGFMLRDRLGHVVWGTNTWHTGQVMRQVGAGTAWTIDLEFPCALGPGSYAFTIALHDTDTHLSANYEWQDNALVFDVINPDLPQFIGSAWVDAKVSIGVARNELQTAVEVARE